MERAKNKLPLTVAPKKVTKERNAEIWKYMNLIGNEIIDAVTFIQDLSQVKNDEDPFFELIDIGK